MADFNRRLECRHYVLDADNRPIEADFVTWAMWFENPNRHVAYTQVSSEITVSTVFLGLDHRWFGEGPPIVFESLVFGGPLDGDGGRYASWDDAETGHKMLVAKCRAAIGQKVKP